MNVPTNTGPEDTVAARVKALRDLRKLTQDQVSERSGGRLTRIEVNKVEGGGNKATSDKIRTGLAQALDVPRDRLADYLDGRITLPEVVAPVSTTVEREERYANAVEAAIFARKSGVDEEAIQVVLSQQHDSPVDPPPLYWLDQMRTVADRLKWERANPLGAAKEREQSQQHTDTMREQLRQRRKGAR